MMTWLSLTTTEKSTALAWYCSMIFGAVWLIVLSSFSRLPASTFSPTISFALTYFACSAFTSASVIPGGGLSAGLGGAGCDVGVGRAIDCVARCGCGGFSAGGVRGNGPAIDSTGTG